jgi:hypothetical protein
VNPKPIPPVTPQLSARQLLTQLNVSANAGDPGAINDLRKVLDQNPEIWQGLGDLARHAEFTLINQIGSTSPALRESLNRKCQQMRSELVGNEPTPLEKAAADRVICCWLEVYLIQSQFGVLPTDVTIARKVDQLKNSSNRRYDSALRSLAHVKQKISRTKKAKKPRGVPHRLKVFRHSA